MTGQGHSLLDEIGAWVVIGAIISGIAYVLASPLGLALAICGAPHPFQRAADALLRLLAATALIVALVMFFGIGAAMFGAFA